MGHGALGVCALGAAGLLPAGEVPGEDGGPAFAEASAGELETAAP
jgi:hypothetical protein